MVSEQIHKFGRMVKSFLFLWNQPLLAMIAAFVIYINIAAAKGFESTPVNYFVYLADAFLHGQFDLRLIPPSIHDLILYQDKLFLYWLPMPSILLMPLVAIFGTSISDVLLTVIVGAINVSIFSLLVQKSRDKNIHQLSPLKSALLIIFFAFGTVHFTLTPYGKVWQLSQEVCLTFMLLTYLFAITLKSTKAFLFTGIALTGAILTRSNVIFVGIWPFFYLLYTHWEKGYKKIIKFLTLAGLPIIVGVLFIFLYNFKRFGNPFEMGLQYHNMETFFQADYEKYGMFNIHYIGKNLYYYLLYYPFPIKSSKWMMGGSIFLLSPVFFSIFFFPPEKSRKPSIIMLWVTIILTSIPLLLLMGTGWVTFGPRYTLDFIVPLLLLTAIGLEKWSGKILALFICISCLHYFIGVILLGI